MNPDPYSEEFPMDTVEKRDSDEEKDAVEEIVQTVVMEMVEKIVPNKVFNPGEDIFQNVIVDLVKEIDQNVMDEKMQAMVDQMNVLDKEISDDINFEAISKNEAAAKNNFEAISKNEAAAKNVQDKGIQIFSNEEELDKYYLMSKNRIAAKKIALKKEIEKEVDTIALYQEVLDELDVEMAIFSTNEPALTKLLNKYYARTVTKWRKMALQNNDSWLQRKKIWLRSKSRRIEESRTRKERGIKVSSEYETLTTPISLNRILTKISSRCLTKISSRKRTREGIEKEKEEDVKMAAISKSKPGLTEPKMIILKENLKVREIVRKKLVKLKKQKSTRESIEKEKEEWWKWFLEQEWERIKPENVAEYIEIETTNFTQYCFIDTNKRKDMEVLLVSSNTVDNTKGSVEPEINEQVAYYPVPPNIDEDFTSCEVTPTHIDEDSTSCKVTPAHSFQVSGLYLPPFIEAELKGGLDVFDSIPSDSKSPNCIKLKCRRSYLEAHKSLESDSNSALNSGSELVSCSDLDSGSESVSGLESDSDSKYHEVLESYSESKSCSSSQDSHSDLDFDNSFSNKEHYRERFCERCCLPYKSCTPRICRAPWQAFFSCSDTDSNCDVHISKNQEKHQRFKVMESKEEVMKLCGCGSCDPSKRKKFSAYWLNRAKRNHRRKNLVLGTSSVVPLYEGSVKRKRRHTKSKISSSDVTQDEDTPDDEANPRKVLVAATDYNIKREWFSDVSDEVTPDNEDNPPRLGECNVTEQNFNPTQRSIPLLVGFKPKKVLKQDDSNVREQSLKSKCSVQPLVSLLNPIISIPVKGTEKNLSSYDKEHLPIKSTKCDTTKRKRSHRKSKKSKPLFRFSDVSDEVTPDNEYNPPCCKSCKKNRRKPRDHDYSKYMEENSRNSASLEASSACLEASLGNSASLEASSACLEASLGDHDYSKYMEENSSPLWEELHKTLQQKDTQTGGNDYPCLVLNQLLRTYKPISGLHLCFFFNYNNALPDFKVKKEINGEVKELLSCGMITGSTEVAESEITEPEIDESIKRQRITGSTEVAKSEIGETEIDESIRIQWMLESLLHQAEDLKGSLVYKLHLEEADWEKMNQEKNPDQSWVIIKEIKYQRGKQDLINFYIYSLESRKLHPITKKVPEVEESFMEDETQEIKTDKDIDNPDKRQSSPEIEPEPPEQRLTLLEGQEPPPLVKNYVKGNSKTTSHVSEGIILALFEGFLTKKFQQYLKSRKERILNENQERYK